MGQFLSYSLVSGLLMLALFLTYRVLLAGENQHGYNRIILLLIYVVSFSAVPTLNALKSIATSAPHPSISIETVEIAHTNTSANAPIWAPILIWIFIIGMIITAVKTTITWIKIIRVVHSGKRIEKPGYSLIITDDEHLSPFSWHQYIIINRKDFAENHEVIAAHELKHVECRHWIDLLIAQIVCIVNWFNPAAWLMRDELMLVHEYQADMSVIDNGFDPQLYQMLLIKKAVGARFPSLANSLNHSKLKKRITMMYQEKSGAGRRFKALALVPMLALALGVIAVPAVRAAVSTINNSELSVNKGSENIATAQNGSQVFKIKSLNNDDGKTTVTIQGEGLGDNLTVSGGTFTTKGKTYKANALKCNMTNGVAKIVVSFPFLTEFDQCSMTLMVNGEEIRFDLEDFFNNAAEPRVLPDELPRYPGGEAAMMEAIMSKITFPDPNLKWKAGAGGLTIIKFTVMPDGTMSDFERVRSCGYGDLDQMAVDAIKSGLTERWTPGTVGGKPVAVSFNLPVRFKTVENSK